MLTGLTGWLIIWFGGALLMALCPYFSEDKNDTN